MTDALGIDPMAVLGPLKSGKVRPLAVGEASPKPVSFCVRNNVRGRRPFRIRAARSIFATL
ncbi:MAG TPA: hypothetical protein VJK06_04635 [Methyloceanibacter sp.]|nr:hypothetical protein [Methyloceanibacter sp.]